MILTKDKVKVCALSLWWVIQICERYHHIGSGGSIKIVIVEVIGSGKCFTQNNNAVPAHSAIILNDLDKSSTSESELYVLAHNMVPVNSLFEFNHSILIS